MIRLARSRGAYFAFLLLALWPSMSQAQSNSQTGPSAQIDPFVGNWRWVPERSRVIFRGTVPKDINDRFVVENGKLREESEIILPDGRSVVAVYIHQYDGQEHPWESTGETRHRKHSILWKRIDDHTVERRINHDDGKEYATDRLVISPDGRELTMMPGLRSDGTPSSVITFVRR